MLRKSVDEQLLEAERADREARIAHWRESRLNDLAATVREVGRKLYEEDPNHPAHDYIARAAKLLSEVR